MMNRTAARLAALLTGLALSSGCGSGYIVDVSNGTVSVDAKFWKPMENPEAFADNFEAREKRPSEVYNQVLTVFKSPIRDDQKLGLALSPGTWCEFMSLHPPAVTLRVRVAHTGHWVMSRQTVTARLTSQAFSQADLDAESPETLQRLLTVYSDEVARTRSVLDALVAR